MTGMLDTDVDLVCVFQDPEAFVHSIGHALELELDDDSTRFAIQWTGFVGPHAHGLNW